MAILFGTNRGQALRSVFRVAGGDSYGETSGLTRKRLDAMLGRFFRLALA